MALNLSKLKNNVQPENNTNKTISGYWLFSKGNQKLIVLFNPATKFAYKCSNCKNVKTDRLFK